MDSVNNNCRCYGFKHSISTAKSGLRPANPAVWGDIHGDITKQEDLMKILADYDKGDTVKADKIVSYTEGENITIKSPLHIERETEIDGTAHFNNDVKIGEKGDGRSLYVSGTANIDGELHVNKSIHGNNSNMEGFDKIEANSINSKNIYNVDHLETGTLVVGGSTFFNGNIDVNGNNITNVQSITVNGTSRLNGDTKTKGVAPNEDKKSNLGKESARYNTLYATKINAGDSNVKFQSEIELSDGKTLTDTFNEKQDKVYTFLDIEFVYDDDSTETVELLKKKDDTAIIIKMVKGTWSTQSVRTGWKLNLLDDSNDDFDIVEVVCTNIYFDMYNRLFENWENLLAVLQMTIHENAVNLIGTFSNCSNLEYVNTRDWNTSHIINIGGLFDHCSKLKFVDVSNFDVSHVTDFNSCFAYCHSLNDIDVSKWETESAEKMSHMFVECFNLTNLDVKNWNTSGVKDLQYMFYHCDKLKELDLSNWETSNVTSLKSTWHSCFALESLNLESWSTPNVIDVNSFVYKNTALRTIKVSPNFFMMKQGVNFTSLSSFGFNADGLSNGSFEDFCSAAVEAKNSGISQVYRLGFHANIHAADWAQACINTLRNAGYEIV